MEKKRLTIKIKHPNPLFEKWLTEWRDKERENNSKKQHCYTNALKSLKKYPLPLQTGKDCIILQGFGPKLCQMLDDKLKGSKNNTSTDIQTQPNSPLKQTVPADQNIVPKKTKKPKKVSVETNSEYCPAYRSGPYAILVTLYKDSIIASSKGYLLKNDIIKLGQNLCDKSFTKPDPGTFYTAWSSMTTLISKNLVKKESNPPKFSLTDNGLVVAHKLYKNSLNEDNNESNKIVNNDVQIEEFVQATKSNDVQIKESVQLTKYKNVENDVQVVAQATKTKKTKIDKYPSISSISSESTNTEVDTIIFAPYSFEILLLVDTQETSGLGKKSSDDEIILELNNLQVQYEIRHLKVGDYAWICREKNLKKELVLPYIIERKRMDDLGSSIKDGRFHEQKFRLKQSGIQNLIYLVESYGSNKHTGLPLSALNQAATNTLIQDEFSVKFTESLRATAEYLAIFSNLLINLYKGKTLLSCPKNDLVKSSLSDDLIALMTFSEFNQNASKQRNLKVKELFIKQLLQLKGLSVDKALAITEIYPTPRTLKEKYADCTPKQAENLLSNIQFGKLNKKIGPVISKTIFQLYSLKDY